MLVLTRTRGKGWLELLELLELLEEADDAEEDVEDEAAVSASASWPASSAKPRKAAWRISIESKRFMKTPCDGGAGF
jgi:predicted RNA polymerase sigma factor